MVQLHNDDMLGAEETQGPGAEAGLRMVVPDLSAVAPRQKADAVAEALREAVRTGRLTSGTTLPASRSLASDLGVSRGVVVRAYEQLVAEGYLRARQGSGTVVGEVHTPDPAPSGDRDLTLARNPGLPALSMFPRQRWARAVARAVEELPAEDLAYGDPRGHPRLRAALAAWLGRTRAVVADPSGVLVTTGYAQASRLVAEALVAEGIGPVAVEDPGSAGVTMTMRAGGATTLPVPVDAEGLRVDQLRAGPAAAVVVTPAHQFPTGAVLGPSRRAALLDWAAGGGLVVEDDYDAEYRYDRAPVGAMQGLAPDRVVYGGSVSKVLAPAMRLGWLVAPGWLMPALTAAKFTSDIASAVIDQVALAVLLETGELDRHIRRTTQVYARRRRRLLAAVATHLPGWEVQGIAAGLHAVLLDPERRPLAPDGDLAGRAGELGLVPLAAHLHHPRPAAGLVIGWASATVDPVDRGIAALAAGW